MLECIFPKRNDNFKSLRLVNRKQLLQEALISSENKHINDFITKDQHKELKKYIESLGKIYHAPANLMCIVDRENITSNYDEFGPDTQQNVEFRFNKERLRTHEIPQIRDINGNEIPADAIQNTQYGYPEIGDIILFDEFYYEINNVMDTMLIGGSSKIYDQSTNTFSDASMQLVATGMMVKRSQVQIEERTY